jgi:light-regulated signal transduction histidine kinase (bacteriophytochrome)
MNSAAERMQILIKDLLTFSRVTSKAQPFVEVDLQVVAKEVLSDLETTIERLNAKVELLELPMIEADPLQMRQLLQNLIGNGLKFHIKDQIPVVKVYSETINKPHRVLRGKFPNQDFCKVVVEDNGIGFDDKYSDRIFAVFQRLHGRSEYEGTGVGLAICRKIVERHGGTITAESAPGKGAKFIFTIPLKQHKLEKYDGEKKKDLKKQEVQKSQESVKKTVYKGHEPSIMQPVT